MSNRFSFLIVTFLVSSLLFSCTQKSKTRKPRSIGNTSEILVVIQNENQWDDTIGITIKNKFGKDQYGLNQAEPLFKVSHVLKNSFSDLLRKHHNLFIVNIDRKAEKPVLEHQDDFWSAPQSIYKLTASSESEFVKIFNNNAEKFIESFQQTDRERILELFRTQQNGDAVAKVKKSTGIEMVIPNGFYVAKDLENFVWIRKEQVDMSQGVFIIMADYQDTAQFSKSSILARTKRALRNNVPGAVYNSYMSIDEEFIPPMAKNISNFPLGYAIEVSGTWIVENDFMGGPFKSYTFFDDKSNKIVTMMAYVYKPSEKKRDLLKQVEALIYSIKIPKQD